MLTVELLKLKIYSFFFNILYNRNGQKYRVVTTINGIYITVWVVLMESK